MAKKENRSGYLSPFEEIFEPLDDFFRPSRLIGDFFKHGMSRSDQRWMSPMVDVEEKGDEYLVSADLPGFKKDEIKIDCTLDQLTITAECSQEETNKRSSRRSYGSFYRAFALPPGTKTEQIRADYENGVLQIRIPRSEDAKPRRIEIGAETKNQAGQESSPQEPISVKGASGTKDQKTEPRSTHH